MKMLSAKNNLKNFRYRTLVGGVATKEGALRMIKLFRRVGERRRTSADGRLRARKSEEEE
jgi:hypothetical protein